MDNVKTETGPYFCASSIEKLKAFAGEVALSKQSGFFLAAPAQQEERCVNMLLAIQQHAAAGCENRLLPPDKVSNALHTGMVYCQSKVRHTRFTVI